jgi:hypothetical protein
MTTLESNDGLLRRTLTARVKLPVLKLIVESRTVTRSVSS